MEAAGYVRRLVATLGSHEPPAASRVGSQGVVGVRDGSQKFAPRLEKMDINYELSARDIYLPREGNSRNMDERLSCQDEHL